MFAEHPFTIRYANATIGSPCIIDNTTYTDVGLSGQMFSTVVVRDNCRSPQYYCGQNSLLCEQSKALGSPCQIDQECEQASLASYALSSDTNSSSNAAELCHGILCGTTRNSTSCSSLAVCYHSNVYQWRCVLPPHLQCQLSSYNGWTAMVATCLMLTLIHKRHRLKRYRELREYYMEQLRRVFHHSLF